ncbi:acyltransferase [Novosphingobium flavum]|uniref:Acyltransferase n=1 Tax=Novosphingobium flavum TaxID=1778672 RepID=A0A7X1KMD8_9SPHN|nr:acyltransferase [Novosphingobium flavum]MBC2666210.1 acyltransferase [Novosphingobium flavum]
MSVFQSAPTSRLAPQDEGVRSLAADPFITAPLSTCLDLIRFFAALVVLVCHAAQARLYEGWFPDIPLAQHYAVVVFFVLSGLVITASVLRGPASFSRYAIARASRILPVSLTALAFSTLAYFVVTSLGGSAQHTDTYGKLSWAGTVLPLMFLSESPWGAGPVWNPPYWSLCYEVWYYALFGAAVFLRGPQRIGALALFALFAGPRILLMFPVWLVGVVLVLTPLARRTGPLAGAMLVAAGLTAAWLHTEWVMPGLHLIRDLAGPYRNDLSFSRFALSDLLLALAVAATFAGLRPIANRWPAIWQMLDAPARKLSGFSFTLYLFHWPLLLLAKTLGLTAGDSLPGFLIEVLSLLAACYAISFVTERQSGRVRTLLERGLAALRERRAALA